tara:strand:- start:72 stop:245 length:174 start_codon:yes stop_codon:yes gene_type:complete
MVTRWVVTGQNAETELAHLEDTDGAVLNLDVTTSQQDINAIIDDAIDQFGQIDASVE